MSSQWPLKIWGVAFCLSLFTPLPGTPKEKEAKCSPNLFVFSCYLYFQGDWNQKKCYEAGFVIYYDKAFLFWTNRQLEDRRQMIEVTFYSF